MKVNTGSNDIHRIIHCNENATISHTYIYRIWFSITYYAYVRLNLVPITVQPHWMAYLTLYSHTELQPGLLRIKIEQNGQNFSNKKFLPVRDIAIRQKNGITRMIISKSTILRKFYKFFKLLWNLQILHHIHHNQMIKLKSL